LAAGAILSGAALVDLIAECEIPLKVTESLFSVNPPNLFKEDITMANTKNRDEIWNHDGEIGKSPNVSRSLEREKR